MGVLVVSEKLVIQSHRGPYSVFFGDKIFPDMTLFGDKPHFLIDSNVARLHESSLKLILAHPNTLLIEATEDNKSIEKITPILERLVLDKVRRDHTLVAIGGGVIQDITCFIASTLLRGLPWSFLPTTLLAQADSCIGSKSSINLGATKNILGTFNPPQFVFIYSEFLDTLESQVIHSGVGEIIKVHAIDGVARFDQLTADYEQMFLDRVVLQKYIRSALLVKQRFIEEDEFDRGIRNIFNYGHSFGHAIESTTNYMIPHGIAVTIGMDMANYISAKRDLLPMEHYHRMHPVLRKNYEKYAGIPISADTMVSALMKDKKNTSTMLGLVFPVGVDATIQRVEVLPDETFCLQCQQFLAELKR
jgi:3-dehydroquinate synthase